MDEDLYRSAIIKLIKDNVSDDQLQELFADKLTVQFETTLYSKQAEVTVKHYDQSMIMVIVHVPRVRWSVYFIPRWLIYPGINPQTKTFSQTFGQMRL